MKVRALAIFIVLSGLMICSISAANASITVSDYSFYKTGQIIGSPDGALNDYQVMFVVHRGNGTDHGQDVYLNGHSLSWPNDIRFAGSDDGFYPYWIESSDASTAKIWVKIDRIPKSPAAKEIKILYGNTGDMGASDGQSTFIFFDGFDGTAVDWSKWDKTASYQVNPTEAGGRLTVAQSKGGGTAFDTIDHFGINTAARWKGMTSGPYTEFHWGYRSSSGPDISCDFYGKYRSEDIVGRNYISDRVDTPTMSSSKNTDHVYDIKRKGTSSVEYSIDDEAAYNIATQVPTGDLPYGIAPWDLEGGQSCIIDYVCIYQTTANEPEIGLWRMEDSSVKPPVLLSGYSFAKSHIIQGSPDGSLAGYQMMFVVHNGTGIDNGQNVYLNNGSMSWPNDIRFTDTGGNVYPYWIESYDADMAVIWVKTGFIPASPGSAQVIMDYGRPNDMGVSNGDDTFILFDDFNENTLNGSKWVKVMGDASADAYVRNGELELRSGSIPEVSRPFIRSSDTYYGNYTIDVDAKYAGLNSIIVATNWDGTLAGQYRGPDNGYECFYNSWSTNGRYWEIARDTGNQAVNLGQYDYTMDNEFHRISVMQKPEITLEVDGTALLSGAIDNTYKGGYVGLGGREGQNGVQTYYDNFRMRQYTDNPPVQGAWTVLKQPGSASPQASPTSAAGTGIMGLIGSNLILIIVIVLAFVLLFMLGILAVIVAITLFRS